MSQNEIIVRSIIFYFESIYSEFHIELSYSGHIRQSSKRQTFTKFLQKSEFFLHFLPFLKKCSVFKPPICGQRPPEHHVKFLGLQNIIVEHLRAETTCENESPALPAEFCPKTLMLAHFREVEDFWDGRESPETRRRTHKIFWEVPYYFTFRHSTIILR